jgi:uncharacterized protein YndB with AHSA1/START domain
MAQTIHQEVVFDAPPERIYAALTEAGHFRKLSGGAPTELEGEAGGRFSFFGGMIEGRNVELVPNRRIVQAWRVKTWEPGLFSLARFELKDEGKKTRVVFDHLGFPEAEREHLATGWGENYWEPLRKFLG